MKGVLPAKVDPEVQLWVFLIFKMLVVFAGAGDLCMVQSPLTVLQVGLQTKFSHTVEKFHLWKQYERDCDIYESLLRNMQAEIASGK